MAIMQEAIDKEDFERKERGLRPRPKKKVEMPKPKPLTIKQIRFDSIPLSDLVGYSSSRKLQQNEDGVKFVGFEVTIQLKNKKPITGWMPEADMIKLQQCTGRVPGSL